MTERQMRGDSTAPIAKSYQEMCDRCDALGHQFDTARAYGKMDEAESILLDLKSIAAEWGIGIQVVDRDDEDSQ